MTELNSGFTGPFIMHFDGSAWAVVEPPATAAGRLEDVIVLPGGEAWGAGKASPDVSIGGYSIPLVTSTERHP